MNSFAKAWLDAANDLGIRVIHPVSFQTNNGVKAESVGVLLPDFGSKNGTLLTYRLDTDEVMNLADDTDYYQSGLNPHCYEPYDREEYIETLNDWGWFGSPDDAPECFQAVLASMDVANKSLEIRPPTKQEKTEQLPSSL